MAVLLWFSPNWIENVRTPECCFWYFGLMLIIGPHTLKMKWIKQAPAFKPMVKINKKYKPAAHSWPLCSWSRFFPVSEGQWGGESEQLWWQWCHSEWTDHHWGAPVRSKTKHWSGSILLFKCVKTMLMKNSMMLSIKASSFNRFCFRIQFYCRLYLIHAWMESAKKLIINNLITNTVMQL